MQWFAEIANPKIVKLATNKTLDFYYTVITNDLNEKIFLFCG